MGECITPQDLIQLAKSQWVEADAGMCLVQEELPQVKAEALFISQVDGVAVVSCMHGCLDWTQEASGGKDKTCMIEEAQKFFIVLKLVHLADSSLAIALNQAMNLFFLWKLDEQAT